MAAPPLPPRTRQQYQADRTAADVARFLMHESSAGDADASPNALAAPIVRLSPALTNQGNKNLLAEAQTTAVGALQTAARLNTVDAGPDDATTARQRPTVRLQYDTRKRAHS